MTFYELGKYGELSGEHWQIQRRIQQGKGQPDDKSRLKQLSRRLVAISDFISDCSDPLVRECMKHKFIEQKSWEEVAMSVGGYNSAGSCRMLVIRYLNRENKKKRK